MIRIKVLFFLALATVFFLPAQARKVSSAWFGTSPFPVSEFADTEFTTNILFNTRRVKTDTLHIDLYLESTSSNNIQIAFGTDSNKDGILSFDETSTIYGWNIDRYFIEDVIRGVRYEDIPDTPRVWRENFHVFINMNKRGRPIVFMAEVERVRVFNDLSLYVPSWLYNHNWDILKITRRGAEPPSEWTSVGCAFKYMYITIK